MSNIFGTNGQPRFSKYCQNLSIETKKKCRKNSFNWHFTVDYRGWLYVIIVFDWWTIWLIGPPRSIDLAHCMSARYNSAKLFMKLHLNFFKSYSARFNASKLFSNLYKIHKCNFKKKFVQFFWVLSHVQCSKYLYKRASLYVSYRYSWKMC